MHVLPSGFQKIRYYGFLNNRKKRKNLRVIFQLQNGQRFKQRYQGMTMAELLKAVWNFDICLCPAVKGTLISLFLLPEKDAIPIQSRHNFRELVQLERIISYFLSHPAFVLLFLQSPNPADNTHLMYFSNIFPPRQQSL